MLVPGLIKFRGVSGYPRWAEESPLRQLPAGPAGDNRVFPHHRLSSLPLFHYARLTSLPLGLSMMYIPAARTSRKVSRDAATGEFVTYW